MYLAQRSHHHLHCGAASISAGSITLASLRALRRYGAMDLSLAEELGRRAALAVDNARLYAEAQEAIRAMIPLGRRGGPRELACAVRFLLGDEASYITGSVVTVDGGLSMGA